MEGARRYTTAVSIRNMGNEPVEMLLETLNAKGQPLNLPYSRSNGGLAGMYSFATGTVGPKADVSPMLTNTADVVKTGWARVTFPAGAPIAVSSYISIQDTSRGGVIVQKAAESTMDPIELGVENNQLSKFTWLNLVNPGDDPVLVALRARRADGSSICEDRVRVDAHGQVQQTTQRLVKCVKAASINYTLTIEPMDGEIAASSHYEYGPLVFANVPLFTAEPDAEEESLSASSKTAPRAATSVCRPDFDPAKMRFGPDAQELEVEMSFENCSPGKSWILKKSSASATWFQIIDAKGRSVSAMTGVGTKSFTIRIDAAAAKKYSSVRTGYLYVNEYTGGRTGKVIASYSFSQTVPKL